MLLRHGLPVSLKARLDQAADIIAPAGTPHKFVNVGSNPLRQINIDGVVGVRTDRSKGAGMANGDTNLEALVGECSMEPTFPFDPPIAGRGRVSFERLLGGLPLRSGKHPGWVAGGWIGRGTVSERLRSVVEQLDIRLEDRVLEIGCGHGVAATLVCQRLETVHLTAIDRSEKMIRAAARRNAAFVEAGRAEFLVADLEDFDPGERCFDKIFAVRVGLFHREPERARVMVERWLASGGTVSVFFDQPANGRKRNP